jgi:hypothetical protein
MMATDWRLLLAKVWHRTFGEVKCHSHRWCPICRDTDWPMAPWVEEPSR